MGQLESAQTEYDQACAYYEELDSNGGLTNEEMQDINDAEAAVAEAEQALADAEAAVTAAEQSIEDVTSAELTRSRTICSRRRSCRCTGYRGTETAGS